MVKYAVISWLVIMAAVVALTWPGIEAVCSQ